MLHVGYWFTKQQFLDCFATWNPTAVETCEGGSSASYVEQFCVMNNFIYRYSGTQKTLTGRSLYAPMICDVNPDFFVGVGTNDVDTRIQIWVLKSANNAASTDLIGFVGAKHVAFNSGKTYNQFITDGVVIDQLIGDIDPSDVVSDRAVLLQITAKNQGRYGASNPTWGDQNLLQFIMFPTGADSYMVPNTIKESSSDYGQAVQVPATYKWSSWLYGTTQVFNFIDPEDWNDEEIYWTDTVMTDDVTLDFESVLDLAEYVDGGEPSPEPEPGPVTDLDERVSLLETLVDDLEDDLEALNQRVTALESSSGSPLSFMNKFSTL